MNDALRALPAVGRLLSHPEVGAAVARHGHGPVTGALREVLAEERVRLQATEPARSPDALVAVAIARLEWLFAPRLRRVVNGTGVVINTNLGRSPLAPGVLEHLMAVGGGYSNLEQDLDSGQRGSRYSHVEALLCGLTGAEAALVVNNCAAAVLLVVDGCARGREVVVSRGQLIEIGGSYRLPEVIEASGAKLVEVGTTNKTYLRDYERRIGPETGLLMLSHTSNYRVIGFTAEVEKGELAALGRDRGIVTFEDLGSGLLVDLTRWGVPAEPTVQQSVAAGLDLVAVSGDKLMGGPQCGIVLGKRSLVAALKHNPLMRALRPDKLTLAALEGTLKLYLRPDSVADTVPIMAMMARSLDALERAAQALAAELERVPGLAVRVLPGLSSVGGGTLPGVELPTWLVGLAPDALGLDAFARRLRTGDPAVVGRIADRQFLLDPRTLLEGDAARVLAAVGRALSP